MNKTLFILSLLLSLRIALSAQATVKIAGGHIVAKGQPYIVVQNMDWENNGSFVADQSTVTFRGITDDTIKGSSQTTFYQLVLQKTTGKLVMGNNSQVDDTLHFVAGNLDLNGNDLTLGTAEGTLSGETEARRIVGSGGGEVIKTIDLNAPSVENPGNLGLTISSAANLGTTTVKRGHVSQTLPGNASLERYYEVRPGNNAALNAAVSLSYFDAELNGLSEGSLESWHDEGTNWINIEPTSTDGSANFVEVALDTLGRMTLGGGALKFSPKAFLQGSYTTSNGLMNDGLRTSGEIPTLEPYDNMVGFTHVGGGGETISSDVLSVTGNDAIVDWIFLELRDQTNGTTVRTQSALIQKDGDIVGLDGKTAVTFAGLPQDDYYIFLRHRNHLGVRSPGPISLARIETNHDFTTGLAQAYDNPAISTNDAMVDLGSSIYGLYRGNSNSDGFINIVDFLLVRSQSVPNQSNVYLPADINLDGIINVVDFLIGRAQSVPNKTAHQ